MSKCISALKISETPLGAQEVDRSAENYKPEIGKGWKSFFVNTMEKDCPLKKCVMKKVGCQSIYDGVAI